MQRVIAIDTETTGLAPKPHFSATPSWPNNKMLCAGFVEKMADGTPDWARYVDGDHLYQPVLEVFLPRNNDESVLLIGHNIAFDLRVLAKAYGSTVPVLFGSNPNIQVWDTMVADYVLSGQADQKRDLESVARYHGIGYTKDIDVVKAIEAGHLEAMYHDNKLVVIKYMLEDAETALKIAEAQMAGMPKAQERLMTAMQEMVIVKAAMEEAGIPLGQVAVDKARHSALSSKISLATQLSVALHDLTRDNFVGTTEPTTLVPWELITDQTMVSATEPEPFMTPTVMNRLFYQSTYESDVKVPKTFKNGKTTMVKGAITVSHKPVVGVAGTMPTDWPTTPGGKPSLDERTLDRIAKEYPSASKYIDLVKQVRSIDKLLGTYIDGMTGFAINGRVHCNYNTTVTRTARLSSSQPNMQNPPPEAKAMFVSSTGKKFIEIDYQQLEVVALAILSGDTHLQDDIRNGVDIHTALYKDMYGREPTKGERKAFKPLTFGLIYGAGDNTLAENAGVTKDEAKRFRKTFFKRYQRISNYYSEVMKEVTSKRFPSTKKSENGIPLGVSVYTLPSGRQLVFHESCPEWAPKKPNFAPADLMNWPVQSFATGDVVPTMLVVLARALWQSEYAGDATLLGTTHDSIMLECDNEKVEEVWNFCYRILSNTSNIIATYYGMNIDVPLNVSGAAAFVWSNCDADGFKLKGN